MSKKDTLGDRMKLYEGTFKRQLMRKTPVIVRLDGKAFHTYTRHLKEPFFQPLHDALHQAALNIANQIQGCKLIYIQSDEISFLLTDWDKRDTCAWFDYTQNKIESVLASMFTAHFNKLIGEYTSLFDNKLAFFDARAFNIPTHEVVNYFVWRQQDASRNSVQMLGHHNFSQKEMHGKNNSQVQDMLMLQKNINWNALPVWAKRGSCVKLSHHYVEGEGVFRKGHVSDYQIPIFTQDRDYIQKLLTDFVEEV